MKKTTFIVLVLITALLGLASAGLLWRRSVVARQGSIAAHLIDQALKVGDFVTARSALKRVVDTGSRDPLEKRILLAEMDHGLKVRDTELLQMVLGNPSSADFPMETKERAALVLARQAVRDGNEESYRQWSESWAGKGAQKAQWFLLSCDQLLATGKRDEAKAMLMTGTFSGRDEACRLGRLALLEAGDPAQAYHLIELGLKEDSGNADLHSFRGQIMEATGRTDQAIVDYRQAVASEPDNPLHRDALANFHRRQGDLHAAVEAWKEAAAGSGLGVYGFKAWFWARMAGLPLDGAPPDSNQRGWVEVVSALRSQEGSVFLTDGLTVALQRAAGPMKRPELEWLAVLESIRKGDRERALAGVSDSFSAEARQLWPGLAQRLQACLSGGAGKDPRQALAGKMKPEQAVDEHSFVREFSRWASLEMDAGESARFEDWLRSPDAVTGTLLASGWLGAALDVSGGSRFEPRAGSPEWLVFGYAKALQQREGAKVACDWLDHTGHSAPASDLLFGELCLADGRKEAGMAALSSVSEGGSIHASRALWTLAMMALDRGDAEEACRIVRKDQDFAEGPQGIEILARASILKDDRSEAARLYRSIAGQSMDALLFLSKEAFAAGDLKEADKWTDMLVSRYPSEPAFRDNLRKIRELEGKSRK